MIKGKKQMLAHGLYCMKAAGLLHRVCSPFLIVFNYHRIRPDSRNFQSLFDDGVYGPTVGEFDHQMKWLKNQTHVLTETEAMAAITGKISMPRHAVMVTFDDGYLDNYELAYPILKEYGVPAIFFVPTQQITERKLGWWDIIAYLIKRSRKEAIVFDGETIRLHGEQPGAIRHFLKKMKLEPHERTHDLLIRLSSACEVSFPDQEAQDAELMTWEQIREIGSQGIAIGSHTHSHRVLATIAPSEQRDELARSKAILEKQLDRPIFSLAYPVGSYQHFTKDTQSIAEECGYSLGFSFNTGVNAQTINRFDVHRVPAPDDLEMLAAMNGLPGLFAKV